MFFCTLTDAIKVVFIYLYQFFLICLYKKNAYSITIIDKRNVTSSSEEDWQDVDLGWLPHVGTHRDIQFSNNVLKEFAKLAKPLIPSKAVFRKYFTQEKARQWDLFKRKEKIENSYCFLKSENMAGIANRLDEGYIPRPNDGNVLAGVAAKIHSLVDDVENLISEIKAHDQSLFETNGINLKHKWQMSHHICNGRLIESLFSSIIELVKSTINFSISLLFFRTTKILQVIG